MTETTTNPHEQFLYDSKSSSDGKHPQFYQRAQGLQAEIFWRRGRILSYVDQPAPWLMAQKMWVDFKNGKVPLH